MKKVRPSPVHLDRPIVVGVDEKPLAEHVVRMGDRLGQALTVPVHRVHAVPRPPDVWPGLDPARGEALTVQLMDAARRTMEERFRPITSGTSPRTSRPVAEAASSPRAATLAEEPYVEIVPGQAAEVLIEQSRSRRAGMLVLGSHEKRPFLEFGNVLRAVYAKSTIPVWVQRGPAAPIRKILVGIDDSEDSLVALETACVLAKALDAEVLALRCCQWNAAALGAQIDSSWTILDYPSDEIVEAERRGFQRRMIGFEWQDVPHRTEFVHAFAVETLLERAKSADLVVVGMHGRTGLASVLLGGVAYSVLKGCTRPTLAVPSPGRDFRI